MNTPRKLLSALVGLLFAAAVRAQVSPYFAPGGDLQGTATSQQVVGTHLSAPLGAAQGGTGGATLTAHSLLVGEGTSALGFLGPIGDAVPLWTTNSADPTASVIPSCSAATNALAYNTTTHSFACNNITAGTGTVTTTGSPANGNLTKFSGANSITNGDLAGDCTTSGALTITCTKTAGTAFGTFATANAATPPAIGSTTAAAGAFTTLSASGAVSGVGFLNYFASPPAIGGVAAAAGSFTTLSATGNLTTNVASGTQCLHANSAGVVAGTGADCSTGTVTSVALAMPGVFTVTGSPVTGTGTLTANFATGQTANQVLATPNGSTGALSLRSLVAADLPSLGGNLSGTIDAATIVAGAVTRADLINSAAHTVIGNPTGSAAVPQDFMATDCELAIGAKPAASVASAANLTLSGLQTIDGVTLADGSIVLATAQTTGSQNGPWTVHSGAWTRPCGYATGNTVPQFSTVLVRSGNTYGGIDWAMTTAGTVTVDTTATTWTAAPLTLGTSTVAGVLAVGNGGTGASTITAHGLVVGEGTSAVGTVGAMGADTVLQGQGSSADPAAVLLPNCGDSSHALAYSTITHAFSCQSVPGAVSTTGSPASGNLAKFSGAASITNGDLSGDCTTSGTLAITCTKTNGTAFAASATTDTTNAGNISTGTLVVARGGTGAGTLTAHGVVVGEGTSALAATSAGTANLPLVSGGASADPSFAGLTVAGGGTGATTLTAHGVLLGEGTSTVTAVAAMAADTLLQGQGTSSDPAAVAVNNCGDSSHGLSYSTSTHTFGCQSITGSAAAGGSNTQVQYNNSTALGGIANGAAGTVLMSNGVSSVASFQAPVDVQSWTTAGTHTWTKPAFGTVTRVLLCGAGGGGGSGAVEPSATEASGGAGGGGADCKDISFATASLGATETVTLGTGGAGGVARTSTQNGQGGTSGTSSTFGSWLTAYYGGGGGGGATAAVSTGGAGGGPLGGGPAGSTSVALGCTGNGGAQGPANEGKAPTCGGGGGGSQSSGNVNAGGGASFSAAGGGTGGQVTTTPTANAGAAGGATDLTAGGTAGTVGNTGGNGVASTAAYAGCSGAGGGGASTSGTAGTGGAGCQGSGGGGGGAALNGVGNSGAGGKGGDGYAVVITH